jgi:transposase-like protein
MTRSQQDPTEPWRVDETYCRLPGRWAYCSRAIDQAGQVVDVLFSERRNAAAARAFFERAMAATGVIPERVTTGPAAIRRPCGWCSRPSSTGCRTI